MRKSARFAVLAVVVLFCGVSAAPPGRLKAGFMSPPDGRFLMIQPLPPPVLGPLTTVLNWFEELKTKAPNRQ